MAIELTQEIGTHHYSHITEDTIETIFLFQRLSMALQRGNAISFRNTMITKWSAVAPTLHIFTSIFMRTGFMLVGPMTTATINSNNNSSSSSSNNNNNNNNDNDNDNNYSYSYNSNKKCDLDLQRSLRPSIQILD